MRWFLATLILMGVSLLAEAYHDPSQDVLRTNCEAKKSVATYLRSLRLKVEKTKDPEKKKDLERLEADLVWLRKACPEGEEGTSE